LTSSTETRRGQKYHRVNPRGQPGIGLGSIGTALPFFVVYAASDPARRMASDASICVRGSGGAKATTKPAVRAEAVCPSSA